jgi:hypothetical protein
LRAKAQSTQRKNAKEFDKAAGIPSGIRPLLEEGLEPSRGFKSKVDGRLLHSTQKQMARTAVISVVFAFWLLVRCRPFVAALEALWRDFYLACPQFQPVRWQVDDGRADPPPQRDRRRHPDVAQSPVIHSRPCGWNPGRAH